ncbi:hypothetical protein V1227_04400 [Lentzea sp. DG1S-22]|uniref:hypothetical protein n=1 Tax=Lentzea sp. DG1S-22 TaxID=3108822 RepID=UPI002E784170|nr:hypothetical protein [Lentzea sp. DG1S-22]WVH82000.1 hypothetical protein V1227_04400 [Lentzea sp. DG1S-22]
MSERDGHENLYLMSLDNGKFVQITDSDDIDGEHANVSPATEEAFYVEDRTFTSVSLRAPYREKKIRTVPDRYGIKGIPSLASDGGTIAASLHDEDEDRSSLVVIDVRTGGMETVKKIDGKVDHVLINPVHGDTLLYHLFSRGPDRPGRHHRREQDGADRFRRPRRAPVLAVQRQGRRIRAAGTG